MLHKARGFYRSTVLFLALAAVLASCTTSAANVTPTEVPPVPTNTSVSPSATEVIQPSQIPTEAVLSSPTPSGQAYSIDLDGLANSSSPAIVPAVQKTADSPWWSPMPEYLSVTLITYPVNGPITPQIFIYPVADLPAWNPQADKQVKDMQALLASHQVAGTMPFLPLKSEVQVMQTAIKGLDFKNGQGVRYLTQYNSGIVPINNQQLIYTYQGLTNDGQYYVSAILPVIYPGLPADNQSLPPADDPFYTDHGGYLAGIVKMFNEAPSSSFTPDLATLDTMMQSLEVK